MSAPRWSDAWTGGQYSVVRATVCAVVVYSLATAALRAGSMWFYPAGLAVGTIVVGVGAGGRVFALAMALLLPGALASADAFSLSFVVSLWAGLHAFLPPAPYGSVPAAGRADPGGAWTMPTWYPVTWQVFFVMTRIAAAFALIAGMHTTLAGLMLAASVLATFRPVAAAGWLLSLAAGLAAAADPESGGDLAALFVLHLVAFQPAWIPRRDTAQPAVVFYDGHCALCHGAVRFLVSEDVDPPRFRLAPLDGPTFLAEVPESVRVTRPDSIVVLLGQDVLVKGRAAIAILSRLGGLWAVAAAVLRVLPRSLVDAAYDAVAARRRSWFGTKSESCPLMTAAQRSRMDP